MDPDGRQTCQTDICVAVDGDTDFESERRYAELVEFGEAFAQASEDYWRDALSIGVGFVPVVGSIQSVVELVSGRDYITGEDTSRVLAAAGIVAGIFGAKGFLKGGTTLYRAVGPAELADIIARGRRYHVPAGMVEGKYFFKTPQQASNFARMMGDQPYTTTSVRVSRSELRHGQAISPAREGPGYFFATPHVPTGRVSVSNFSVLP